MIFPPPPECYQVGENDLAEGVIVDEESPWDGFILLERDAEWRYARLRIKGGPGQLLTVEVSEDLEHWRDLAPVGLPDGDLLFEYDQPPARARFHRVRPLGP